MIKIIEKEGHFIAISENDNSIEIGKTLEEAYTKANKNDSNDSFDTLQFNKGNNSLDIKENYLRRSININFYYEN